MKRVSNTLVIKNGPLNTYRPQKIKRERTTWGTLDHPNILPLYGFADDEELFQPSGALISPVSWLVSRVLTGF